VAAVSLQEVLQTRLKTKSGVKLALKGGKIVVVAGRVRRPVTSVLTRAEERGGGIVVKGRHYGSITKIDESRVTTGSFYPYTDFTAAVTVAQVDVDRETGQVKVVRCAAFTDIGVAVEPDLVRAQVEGATAMGLGTALTEETMWGPDGRLLNPNLLDYRLPTLGEIPPISVELIEGFHGAGPFGAKGVGEPSIIPVPAAVANAVADATGARMLELPLTPERVARALKLL
jgi:CO/xanthine dehydrogenase Mo-binding subunit